MGKVIIGVFGAGGFAREVMPLARSMDLTTILPKSSYSDVEFVFVVERVKNTLINKHRVLTEEEFFSLSQFERYYSVAIADAFLREVISKKCEENGVWPITISARSSQLLDDCDIGVGAIFCGNVVVTSNVKIGKQFHANIFSYVAHDCIIGDYVTFAPGVHCNGNVIIDDYAYVGTGAIIKHGTPDRPILIGRGAVVGMGAVVTKNVLANSVVVGNPARELVK